MQCDQLKRNAEERCEARSSVYIAGIVSWPGQSVGAKIRNLSTRGALFEAAELPAVGSAVRLTRGSLGVDGVLVWLASGRGGVRFNSLVTVKDWISPICNSQQKRIDETVALLKGGGLPQPSAVRAEVASGRREEAVNAGELASHLRELCLLIDHIGAEVMKDEELIRRHALTLQNIDIVSQSIEAVAGLLSSKSPDVALRARLESLRASRTEALNQQLNGTGEPS